MRIDCAQCRAAFAIDDRSVTERGVRAQCPRCGHLQLVKRGAGPAADSSAATIQDPRFAFGAGGGGSARPSPSGFDLLASPPTDPENHAALPLPDTGADWASAPAGAAVSREADRSPFDFSALAPPPAARDAQDRRAGGGRALGPSDAEPGAATQRWAVFVPDGPSPGAPPAHGTSPFGADPAAAASPSSPTPPPGEAVTPRCATCGKVLVDAFDLALGICDRCREQPERAPGAAAPASRATDAEGAGGRAGRPSHRGQARPASEPAPLTPAPVAPLARPAPLDATPSGRPEARAPVRTGKPPALAATAPPTEPSPATGRSVPPTGSEPVHFGVEASRAGATPLPMAPFQAVGAVSSPGVDTGETRRPSLGRGQGRRFAVVGTVALLGVVAVVTAVVVLRRPVEGPRLVEAPPEGPATPEALAGLVRYWRLRFPELAGQPASRATDYVDEGTQALRLDSARGYLDAEEAFAKALVLAPSSEAAAQGWALVLAFGRGGRAVDEKSIRSAERVLQHFEGKGAASRTYGAHAHLVIARKGPASDVEALAERAFGTATSDEDRALARMALARAVLPRNSDQAREYLDETLRLDPGLKRAHFYQAEVAAATGRLADAAASLRRRLELDKDQWEASLALAKLLVEVGELVEAKNVLRSASFAAPRNKLPLVALAALAAQHEGDLDGALATRARLTTDVDLPREVLALAWAHTAAIERAKGSVDQAQAAVKVALDLIDDHAPALLQRSLLHLDRGVVSQARVDFDAARERLPRPDVAMALEGRLLVAEGRLPEAEALYAQLVERSPYRVDALLLGGAAAAKAKSAGRAWELCLKRAQTADPFSGELEALSDFFVRRVDLMAGARGAYDSLARGRDEDPNPVLCEGLLAWHARDLPTADARFARVLTIDGASDEAAAYRAFVALERGDGQGALRFADRAIAAERTSALGHLARALALRALGKGDLAKVSARNAEKYAPQMSSVRAMLGDMAAAQGSRAEAKELLAGALLGDPFSRAAKRALYERLR